MPSFKTIIEPFAGSAGYSVRHYNKEIILIEKDCRIAGLWKYLIGASFKEIMSLPLLEREQNIDHFDICSEAKSLIGFWLNKGATGPCKTPSKWMRSKMRPKSYWGPEIRARIAKQVEQISHWRIIEGDYSDSPKLEATWFIDPPYQQSGKLYRHSSSCINYYHLSEWILSRKGQVIACENSGAQWLPFQNFMSIKSTPGRRGKSKSKEAIFYSESECSLEPGNES